MPTAFAEFLGKALPKDGGTHTLTLGERHDESAHLRFLHESLGRLQADHALTTIGLEVGAYLNPFLWAYADGTLAAQLGSKKKAASYLQAVFETALAEPYRSHTIASVHLAVAAMDAGIQVVAFDSRQALSSKKFSHPYAMQHFHDYATERKEQLLENHFAATLHNRHDSRQYSSLDTAHLKVGWLLHEVDWLLETNPAYARRIEAIENLWDMGNKKICRGQLTSDGLSSVLFNALAGDTGNRLTISGFSHINGIGKHDAKFPLYHREQVHGTFGKHLYSSEEPPRPHRVTAAVIATTSVARTMSKRSFSDLYSQPAAIAGTEVAHLNLDTGTIGAIWHPDATRNKGNIVSLADKFPVPFSGR